MSTTIFAKKIIFFYTLTCDVDGCMNHASCQTEDNEGVIPPDGWVSDGEAADRNHNDLSDDPNNPDKRLFVEEPCYCPTHAFDCAVCKFRHGGEICSCHACDGTGTIVSGMEDSFEDDDGNPLLVGAACPYLADPGHDGRTT